MPPRLSENRAHNRMAAIVLALKAYHDSHGYGPSIRELMTACGAQDISTFMVMLTRVAAEGLIDWQQGRARTLRLTDRGERVMAMLKAAA